MRTFGRYRSLPILAAFVILMTMMLALFPLLPRTSMVLVVSAEAAEEDISQASDESKGEDPTVAENDGIEDSLFDPLQADPDCDNSSDNDASCWSPPATTIEETTVVTMDASCSFGGDDPDQDLAETCSNANDDETQESTVTVDQHWGSDPQILRMRNKLRDSGSGVAGLAQSKNRRPPVFLLPGLASTRLVAWRFKTCPQHPLLSDIKVLDYGTLCVSLVFCVFVCCRRQDHGNSNVNQ